MSTLLSVTRDDLLTWANTPDAHHLLPQLVRRLILETGFGVEVVEMADGSGVSSGGFDGLVRATGGTSFVPAGTSVWELSVNKGGDRKADADYEKRLSIPDASPTADATYLQVICRPWTTRSAWSLRRGAQGRWREVRAHNVDWLVTWIEQAPATRLWLAERLGRQIDGVVTGTEWWKNWSQGTIPRLTPEIVLAREPGPVNLLKARLGQSGITSVGGPFGSDELLACILASAVQFDGQVAPRVLVVDDRTAWRRLLREPSPLVLVATDPTFISDVGTDLQHTVVVPVSHADDGDIVLEPVKADIFNDALRAADKTAGSDLGFLAHRSFVALRRRLGKRRELMRPPWADGAPSRIARAALLLTTWEDGNAADRSVVEAVAGCGYEDAREVLLSLSTADDPFVALAAGHWHVVSPVDAWLLLGRHLLDDDLNVFVTQALSVLTEIDPALGLPPADRWRAGIEGKVFAHSKQLRQGLASGLALLGTFGSGATGGSGAHAPNWAVSAVQQLLQRANGDGTCAVWTSLSSVLPLLSEAAPRPFLEEVRNGLQGSNPVLERIFQDGSENDWLFGGHAPHTGLLWALENVAWSRDFFANAVELLAALTAVDPGGRMSNRPAASLATIYTPWHPDTSAGPAERLQALDRVRSRWSDVAWNLMVGMMPSTMGGIHFPSHEPHYREWKLAEESFPPADYPEVVGAVLERLIEDVGVSGERWKTLLGAHDSLAPVHREAVRKALATLDVPNLAPPVRRQIWESGRKLVARHREYADTHWALPDSDLSSLETILAGLAPTDPADRHAWLFASSWIDLGDIKRGDDHQAYEAELAARRAAAIAEIEGASGLSAVLEFAKDRAEQSRFVGSALAQALGDRYLDALFALVKEAPDPEDGLARAYLWELCRQGGLEWVTSVIADRPDLPPLHQALLLLYVDDFDKALEAAKHLGDEVVRRYWLNFAYFGLGTGFARVLLVATQLVRVGRHAAALDCLALYAHGSEPTPEYTEVVATAFEGFIEAGNDDETGNLAQWDFDTLFAALVSCKTEALRNGWRHAPVASLMAAQ